MPSCVEVCGCFVAELVDYDAKNSNAQPGLFSIPVVQMFPAIKEPYLSLLLSPLTCLFLFLFSDVLSCVLVRTLISKPMDISTVSKNLQVLVIMLYSFLILSISYIV